MPLRIAGPAAPRCARRMVASRPREKELLITVMPPAFSRRGIAESDSKVFSKPECLRDVDGAGELKALRGRTAPALPGAPL